MSDEKSPVVPGSALGLAPKKLMALQGFKDDLPVGEVAKFANIARSTLRRWMTTDPVFIAEYNAWKARNFAEMEALIVASGPKIVRRLVRRSRTSDRAAIELLKAAERIQRRRAGLTDADEVKQEHLVIKEERTTNRESKKLKLIDQHVKIMLGRRKHQEIVEQAKAAQQASEPPSPQTAATPPGNIGPHTTIDPELPSADSPPPTTPDPAPANIQPHEDELIQSPIAPAFPAAETNEGADEAEAA